MYSLVKCPLCGAPYNSSPAGLVHPYSESCPRSEQVIGHTETRIQICEQLARDWADEISDKLGGSPEQYANPAAYAVLSEAQIIELSEAVGASFTLS